MNFSQSTPPKSSKSISTAALGLITMAVFLFMPFLALAETDKEINSVKVIVLDPGHGGKDTGARGRNGTYEKDINLAMALELKRVLKKWYGYKVILTRDKDVFIPLGDRSKFANKKNADIFVSIHANAAYKKKAKGVETFFLSLEASDDDSRKLAAIENKVFDIEKEDYGKDGDILESILWDMTQAHAHKESFALADEVQKKLTIVNSNENRGVKQANFSVLRGATMPAILVETGFLSNKKEEKLLMSIEYQKKVAHAISMGIRVFDNDLKKSKVSFNRKGI